MRIEITNEDIQNGHPDDERRCPIALALRRAFPHKDVRVSRFRIYIGSDTYAHNMKMFHFAWDFDTNKDVKPFRFNFGALKPYHSKSLILGKWRYS